MLKKFFKIRERNTSISTEIIAGVTTFVTMAYVLAVLPAMLSGTGLSKESIFLATCLGAGFVSIAMGLFVNFSVALAPGMGLSAYFATIANQHGGIPWDVALGAVFISGIIFLILTVTKVRQLLVEAIPDSMKHAITVGIGLFIAVIGLKMCGLVGINLHLGPSLSGVSHAQGFGHIMGFEWDLLLGKITEPNTLLAIIGLGIIGILISHNVRGAILIGIIAATIIGIPMGLVNLHDFHFALPTFSNFKVNSLNIKGALNATMISVIFTFTFVGLMDTFGTLVSTAHKAKLATGGKSPIIGKAMFVDAAGASLGAFLGVPTLTVYLESASGIAAGGRTGITAIVVGLLFLSAIVLSPIFKLIPDAATAPALIVVGAFMITSSKEINFDDFTESLPAFLTIILMPLTYNIANGISAGIVFYTLLKVITGKYRQVHWLMYFLCALILWRYISFN
ncbi:MAG: NCS2 family permease [Gammaproteobacteria bacterium]|nr:NCS2 family permease [Gammaproteobacteria bacterium]